MINTYFQTTEVTDSGYKIIVSENNSLSDDEVISIFQKSEITKSSGSDFRFYYYGLALVKSGLQQDTGRASQNILLVNGIDIGKISEADLEKLKILMQEFFNSSYSTIKDEYNNSNSSSRKIIFASSSLTDFEKNILQLNLPEKKIDLSQKDKKLLKKYFIVGCVFFILFAMLISQIVFAKSLKDIFYKFIGRKTEKTSQTNDSKKEKISIEKQLFESLKMNSDEFEKARLIEPEMAKLLLDDNKSKEILDDIKQKKLIYHFCSQDKVSRFYSVENIDNAQILRNRKINIKLVKAIENFLQNLNNIDISPKRHFSNDNLKLDEEDDKSKLEIIEKLKNYYNNYSINQYDFSIFSNYNDVVFPVYSDTDAKSIDLILTFFTDPNSGYGKWTDNIDDWKKIASIEDLINSLSRIDSKKYEKLTDKINDSKKADEKSVERVTELVKLLINSKTEFLNVLEGKKE